MLSQYQDINIENVAVDGDKKVLEGMKKLSLNNARLSARTRTKEELRLQVNMSILSIYMSLNGFSLCGLGII